MTVRTTREKSQGVSFGEFFQDLSFTEYRSLSFEQRRTLCSLKAFNGEHDAKLEAIRKELRKLKITDSQVNRELFNGQFSNASISRDWWERRTLTSTVFFSLEAYVIKNGGQIEVTKDDVESHYRRRLVETIKNDFLEPGLSSKIQRIRYEHLTTLFEAHKLDVNILEPTEAIGYLPRLSRAQRRTLVDKMAAWGKSIRLSERARSEINV